MATFLDSAHRMAFYRPATDHRILSDIAIKYFGSATNVNIEDLASFLALDLPSDFQTTRELRKVAYDQLLDVIVDTLAGTANFPKDAKTKAAFEGFAKWVADKSVPVITFNYDLIFDQLLRNLGPRV